MNWQDAIIRDPAICRGRPTIKGTRILMLLVLDNPAAGLTPAEIADSYPPLTPEQVNACTGYAS